MHTFTYRYLKLKDVCDFNKLDYTDVLDAVSMSDVSFGTNYDTLITTTELEDILEDSEFNIDGLSYDGHDEYEDVLLISLGS
jgi:hypothetical protein